MSGITTEMATPWSLVIKEYPGGGFTAEWQGVAALDAAAFSNFEDMMSWLSRQRMEGGPS